MSPFSNEWLLEVARNKVHGAKIEHRFGTNKDLGSTWETICTSGEYHTPPTTVQLELVSTSPDDTVGGIGAQRIEIIGVDENWDEVVLEVEMNGTTPVLLPQVMRRVHTMHVDKSGTYATLAAGSHVGDIYLREAGGGTAWADIITVNGFPMGISEIGCYTIPRGHVGYILSYDVVMEANKLCDVALFHRRGAHTTGGGSYEPMFTLGAFRGVSGLQLTNESRGLSVELRGPCDTGFLAATSSGSANISVAYKLLIIDKNVRDELKFAVHD